MKRPKLKYLNHKPQWSRFGRKMDDYADHLEQEIERLKAERVELKERSFRVGARAAAISFRPDSVVKGTENPNTVFAQEWEEWIDELYEEAEQFKKEKS